VQSEGERLIAEWLTAHGIAYRYDAKFRISVYPPDLQALDSLLTAKLRLFGHG